jgi:preprotein translocase subunit SecF
LVGFSVNDSIVIFDRIRENLTLHRDESLYKLPTIRSIKRCRARLSRTVWCFFRFSLWCLFGGEVLRGFSLALFVGSITGTYSTIAIASPIAIWWQDKLGAAKVKAVEVRRRRETGFGFAAFGNAQTDCEIKFQAKIYQ